MYNSADETLHASLALRGPPVNGFAHQQCQLFPFALCVSVGASAEEAKSMNEMTSEVGS